MKLPEPAEPEYRRDPITGSWVVIASERARRPGNELAFVEPIPDPIDCPFCEGREHTTPPEIYALRGDTPPNTPGWSVRVVPNQYPALVPRCSTNDMVESGDEFADSRPGTGHHEVIVEHPSHVAAMAEWTAAHVGDVFRVYRRRLCDLRDSGICSYALLFKNSGPTAGASQQHPHSQILATAMIPPLVQRELDGAKEFFDRNGQCIFCNLFQLENRSGLRVLTDGDHFIAWCPFASRFPFEIWVCPKRHAGRFEETPSSLLMELGGLVRRLLARLKSLLNAPAYNYYIHTAPFDGESYGHYHWHLEITPRILGVAGFELATGMFINPIPPEWAAQCCREEDLP